MNDFVGADIVEPTWAGRWEAVWCLLFFWGVANLLVPEYRIMHAAELMPAGMALGAGLLIPVLLSALRSPASLFHPLPILLVGIFFWLVLDIVQGEFTLPVVPAAAVAGSIHAIALFAIGLVLGSGIQVNTESCFEKRGLPVPGSRSLFVLIGLCFLLAVLQVLLACRVSAACLVEGLLAPRFQAQWQHFDLSGLNTLLFNFNLMGVAIPSLVVLLHKLEGRFSGRVLMSIGLTGIYLLVMIQGGDRRYIGLMVIAAMMTAALLARSIRWKQLVGVTTGLALLIVLLNSIVQIRHSGWAVLFGEGVEDLAYNKAPIIKVDTNFRFLAHVVDIVPERYPHTGIEGIYANLAAPVPRSVLPDKPMLHAFPLRLFVPGLPQDRDWSWTCSAVCDVYLIGGYWSVIIGGALFGILGSMTHRWCASRSPGFSTVTYSLATMSLFVGLRAIRELAILGLALALLYILFWGWQVMARRTHTEGKNNVP